MDDYNRTNFNKVQHFNRAFDMVSLKPETYIKSYKKSNNTIIDPYYAFRFELFTNSPKTILLRLHLITEEINKLDDAIKNNDIIETRNALANILYVVYGMADVLGVEIDYIFQQLCINNNMNEYLNNNSIISNFTYTSNKIGNNPIEFLDIFNYNELNKQDILNILQDNIINTYNNIERLSLSFEDIEYLFKDLSNEIAILLKWVYSYCKIAGFNADYDFAIVHDSNMSKLCISEDEEITTFNDYTLKYKTGSSPYDTPLYYYLPILKKWIIKNKSTGKVLKNINYRKVDFTLPK
jgi:predicted HAD superfamily Cof-like phosphohydrolase